MSIFSICKHTIQECFDTGHRKSTDNVTEIYCDDATFMSLIPAFQHRNAAEGRISVRLESQAYTLDV